VAAVLEVLLSYGGDLVMARKQKPEPDLVRKAAQALKKPEHASLRTIKRMAAIILDDKEYDPEPHRPKRG
jgi:beta-phosphoglucomutase-like phosphatase (HAD superfamily)